MWHKLVLLSLYILVLFFLSRLLEAAFWYHGDHFFSHSVLDPLSLSVTKLRQLLDSRGVSYVNAIEKKDLTNLILRSGEVTHQELLEASKVGQMPLSHQTVHFTCGSHFYEEVEDTKDSVWLVQVVEDEKQAPIFDAATWKQVVSKVGRFGVRTGMFKCSLDQKLCSRKGWNSPLIVLALPRSHHVKEDVVMHSYKRPAKMKSLFKWLHQHLSSRVTKIPSLASLRSDWLNTERNPGDTQLRVICISTLPEPPLFISALAIKFNGRVRFGIIYLSNNELETTLTQIGYAHKIRHSTYLVSTPEKVLLYGNNVGETYSYKRMELYLKSMHPEMNDMFLISLFVVNIMIGLEFFLVSGRFWRHCIRWISKVIKFNFMLFSFWLVLLGAHQFKLVHSITLLCLKFVRATSEMHLSTIIRNDWPYIYSPQFISVVFLAFGLAVTLIWKKLGYGNNEDEALFSDWWSVPWDSYVMNYFFRPMATLTRPIAPQDLDLEEGLEQFIERLAVPNLWLLPDIQMDYLKELPVWKYHGTETEDDGMSQDEGSCFYTSNISSDDETSQKIPKHCHRREEHEHRSCFHSFKRFLPWSRKNRKVQTADNPNQTPSKNGKKYSPLSVNSKSSLVAQNSRKHLNGSDSSTATTSSATFERELDSLTFEGVTEQQEKISDTPLGMIMCTDCSICLESYHQGESLCGLPCGHSYHLSCIMPWLTRDNHCCPICRWPSFKPNPKTNRLRHLHSQ